jgi:hypothetical protein
MKLIIDRFEGNYAVCETENMKMINVLKDLIPPSSKEGDVLLFAGTKYTIDIKATNVRKEKIEKLMDDVWKD